MQGMCLKPCTISLDPALYTFLIVELNPQCDITHNVVYSLIIWWASEVSKVQVLFVDNTTGNCGSLGCASHTPPVGFLGDS